MGIISFGFTIWLSFFSVQRLLAFARSFNTFSCMLLRNSKLANYCIHIAAFWEQSQIPKLLRFFSSSMADVALWLGPYMSISRKKSICTRTKRVRKCRQITTNQTTQRPARRPANPPARHAYREKQQTRHTKGAGAQTKTPTKKICQRTQWFDHCITLKNMRK